jgi:hypothetical protein
VRAADGLPALRGVEYQLLGDPPRPAISEQLLPEGDFNATEAESYVEFGRKLIALVDAPRVRVRTGALPPSSALRATPSGPGALARTALLTCAWRGKVRTWGITGNTIGQYSATKVQLCATPDADQLRVGATVLAPHPMCDSQPRSFQQTHGMAFDPP